MTVKLSATVVDSLEQVWTALAREFKDYRKDQWMFWHEDDLRLHLGHRLIVQLSKKDGFDVHANVRIDLDPEEYFQGELTNALKRAIPEIHKIRKKKNYVDLVVNRRQDVSNPFLLCAEVKYWYYERPDEIREGLEKDLERLTIIKREGVAEQIACLILNAKYDPREKWIHDLERKLEGYERKVGLIKLVSHHLS